MDQRHRRQTRAGTQAEPWQSIQKRIRMSLAYLVQTPLSILPQIMAVPEFGQAWSVGGQTRSTVGGAF